jgi:hypothetical protein
LEIIGGVNLVRGFIILIARLLGYCLFIGIGIGIGTGTGTGSFSLSGIGIYSGLFIIFPIFILIFILKIIINLKI